MPAGRPTSYDPNFHPAECERLALDKDYNLTQTARDFRVCRDTLYQWEKVHPEFSDAIKRARTYSAAGYYDKIQRGMTDPNFNSRAAELCAKHAYKIERDEAKAKIHGLSDAKTLEEEIKCVKKALSQSEITPDQAKTIIDTFSVAVKAELDSKLRPQLSETIEHYAQLIAQAKKINDES